MKLYALQLNSDRTFTRAFLGEFETWDECYKTWCSVYNQSAWEWAASVYYAPASEAGSNVFAGDPVLSGKLPWDSWKIKASLENPLGKEAAARKKELSKAAFAEKYDRWEKEKADETAILAAARKAAPEDGAPHRDFWPLWKKHSDTLKKNGIFAGRENGEWVVKRGIKYKNRYVSPAFGTPAEQTERKKVSRAKAAIEEGAKREERESMDYRAERNFGMVHPENQKMNSRMEAAQEATGDKQDRT